MKDAKEFFQHWFVRIDKWYSKVVMNGRESWVRLYGASAHAWNQKFFEKMS